MEKHEGELSIADKSVSKEHRFLGYSSLAVLGPARVLQLPSHSTVQFIREANYNGAESPQIKIMSFCAYRYQRELFIGKQRQSGTNEYAWKCHAYRHPGNRSIADLTKAAAERLMCRIMELSELYPTLLFHDVITHRDQTTVPINEGFVHFHEALLWGAEPNAKLLD